MKQCPICQQPPWWHVCRNVSLKRKEAHFALGGCSHALTFAKAFGVISESVRSYHEAKWEEEAERLFAKQTEQWTEAERMSFRARIFPVTFGAAPAERDDNF